MNTVIVTRHPALVQYLIEEGIITAEEAQNVVTHATPEVVKDKRVIGVLPIHLAALASTYANIAIFTPPELRGVELTLEQVKQYAQPMVEYKVAIFPAYL